MITRPMFYMKARESQTNTSIPETGVDLVEVEVSAETLDGWWAAAFEIAEQELRYRRTNGELWHMAHMHMVWPPRFRSYHLGEDPETRFDDAEPVSSKPELREELLEGYLFIDEEGRYFLEGWNGCDYGEVRQIFYDVAEGVDKENHTVFKVHVPARRPAAKKAEATLGTLFEEVPGGQ